MSLPVFSTQGSLFSTAGLSASLFGQTDRYRLFAKLIYPLLATARPQLEACYCAENGRIAVEPVILLGVSLLQFLEGLPDRAAVEMLRYHAGWNFALNRQLGDELFHATTLVNFRQRLIDHALSALGFQTILDGLVEAGLVARQSRQRLDSMQIFGRISRMSRLDCVRETLRLALEELAGARGLDEGRPAFWNELWERYVENKLDFRAENAVLQAKLKLAGGDAARLLAWAKDAPGPQLKLLAKVWHENFELDASGETQPRLAQPSGAVHNPHDPEAQWAVKGQGNYKKEHVGYKLQVAETSSATPVTKGEPTPNFITAMVTQPAITSDDAGLPQVEQAQVAMGMEKPNHWNVDAAYISAQRLAQAQAEGRQLIGPAQPAPKKEGRYSVENFQINIGLRQALCPAGKQNTQCSRLEEHTDQKVSYRFEFNTHCHACSLRDQCLGPGQKHRTITVGQFHDHLQKRRQEQSTPEFKLKARERNAIEGTQSELVRAHGMRRARYRGLAKMSLQSYLAGAACNLKRWLRRKAWLLEQAVLASAQLAPVPAN